MIVESTFRLSSISLESVVLRYLFIAKMIARCLALGSLCSLFNMSGVIVVNCLKMMGVRKALAVAASKIVEIVEIVERLLL